ncbi:MAG TPA: gamma-glutamyltransferase, partial [Lacipirellulaceae bacterium]|nr:gamma-glutamyltransferase [Lacipirellulaceae bacterium]
PVLHKIAEGGSAAFYQGDIARTIVRHVQSHGGILSERDFSEYRAQDVAPLAIDYRGFDVYTPPPPAGGLTTLQILQTLKHFDIAAMKPWGAPYFDLLAQATRLCWQERVMALGDPDFIEIPLHEMLSEQRAVDRAQRIQCRDAGTPLPSPTDRPCTANVSIIDSQRNAVSITATQGVYFGSQMVIPGLGLVMNHGMSRFDYAPPANHPNLPSPGKRMQHNMAPTMVLKDVQPRFVVGLPGGIRIISVTAQLAIDLIDFGATAQEAVRAPRIDAQNEQPIIVSSAVSDEVMNELRALGNDVARGQLEGPPMEVGGMANALAFDPETGKLQAASQGSGEFAIVV